MIIGITGSFGSGKTSVAKMFAKKGVRVISADEIVKELSKLSPIRVALKKEFGTTNNKEIAKIVFSNKKLNKLNKIYHPLVIEKIKKEIKLNKHYNKIIVMEVPLLFEARMQKMFDFIIVVKCTKKEQIKRLSKRFEKKDALRRINVQMPLKDKIKYADFVIDNSASLAETKKQFEVLWNKISGKAKNRN